MTTDPNFSNLNNLFSGSAPIEGEPYIPEKKPMSTYLTPLSDMPGFSGVIQPSDIRNNPFDPKISETIELQSARGGHLNALFGNRDGYLAIPEPKNKRDLATFIKPLPGSKLTYNEALVLDSLGLLDDSYIVPETLQKYIDDRKVMERYATHPETRNTLLNLIGGLETEEGTVKPGLIDYLNVTAETLGSFVAEGVTDALSFPNIRKTIGLTNEEEQEKHNRFINEQVIEALVNYANGTSNETFDEVTMRISKMHEESPLGRNLAVTLTDPVGWGAGTAAKASILGVGKAGSIVKGTQPFLSNLVTKAASASKDLITDDPVIYRFVNPVLKSVEENYHKNQKGIWLKVTDKFDNKSEEIIEAYQAGKTAWYDKFNALSRLNDYKSKEYLEKFGRDLPVSFNTAALLSAFRGLDGSVSKHVEKIQQEAISILGGDEKNLNLVGQWMQLIHMKDVLAMHADRIFDSNLTPQVAKIKESMPWLEDPKVIAQAIEDFQKELGPELFSKVERASQTFIDDIRSTFMRSVNAGEINAKLAEDLITKYPNYNPILYVEQFARMLDSGKVVIADSLSDFGKAAQFVGKLSEEGSDMLRLDPIVGHYFYTASMERLHQMNQIIKSIVRGADSFVYEYGLTGDFVKKVYDRASGEMVEITTDVIQPAKSSKPIKTIKEIIDDTEEKVTTIFGRAEAKKNQITFLANGGKQYIYDVHEDIYKAVQALTDGTENEALKFLDNFKNVNVPGTGGKVSAGKAIRATLVDLNPKFMLRALFADGTQAAALYGTKIIGIDDILKGKIPKYTIVNAMQKTLKSLFIDDKEFDDFILAGGDVIGYYGKNPTAKINTWAQNALKNKPGLLIINDKIGADIFNPLKFVDNWMKIAHRMELSPRFAVYRDALSEGVPKQVAIQMAREVTGDFSKMGTKMEAANKIWWYLNPAFQGFIAPFRAMASSAPNPTAWQRGMEGFMLAHIVAYMHNRTEEAYWAQTQEERYGGLQLVIPSKEYDEDNNLVSHGLGWDHWMQNWSSPIIHMLETMDIEFKKHFGDELLGLDLSNDEVRDVVDHTDFLQWWVGSTMNPIGSATGKIFNTAIVNPIESTAGKLPFLPTIATFPAELWNNVSTFTNQPIVPPELRNKPPKEQYDEFTSPTAIRLGEWIGKSPMMIEHVLQTGSMREILLASDNIIRKKQGLPTAEVSFNVNRYNQLLETFTGEELAKQKKLFWAGFAGNNSLEKAVRFEIDRSKSLNIPFISSIMENFYAPISNVTYQIGLKLAEQVTGFSAAQTQQASNRISRYMDTDYYPARYLVEQQFLNYQKDPNSVNEFMAHPDHSHSSIPKGISPKHYLASIKEQDSYLRFFIESIDMSANLPQAVQSSEDPQAFVKWSQEVYKIANAKDTNPDHKLNTLALGFKAIPVYDEFTNQPITATENYVEDADWDRLDKDQKEYLKNLTPKEKRDLKDYLDRNKTETEKLYEKDQEEYLTWWWKVVDYEIDRLDTKLNPNGTENTDHVLKDKNGHNVRWHYDTGKLKSGDDLERHKATHLAWDAEMKEWRPVLNILESNIAKAREQLIKGEYTHPDFIKDFKKPGDDLSSFTFVNRMQILGSNIDYKRVFWGFAEAPKLVSTEQRIANSKPNVNLISNFKPTDPRMTDLIQRLPPQLPPDR